MVIINRLPLPTDCKMNQWKKIQNLAGQLLKQKEKINKKFKYFLDLSIVCFYYYRSMIIYYNSFKNILSLQSY